MTNFRRLFQLDVAHEFFAGEQAPVRIVPDDWPREMIVSAGLSLHSETARIQVVADADPARLKDFATEGLVTFHFALRSEDERIPYVTAPLSDPIEEGKIPVLELLADGVASTIDSRIPTGQHAYDPFAFVRVAIDPDSEDARFLLTFPARSLIWTYHVVGARHDAQLRIRDTTGNVEFAQMETKTMPGGRPVHSFVSTAPIMLVLRQPERLELVEEGPSGAKVILPVLPTPTPGPTAEIYVTL